MQSKTTHPERIAARRLAIRLTDEGRKAMENGPGEASTLLSTGDADDEDA